MDNSRSYPGFFTVYLPEINSDRMAVPRDFVARVKQAMPEKVLLKNPLGRVWEVDVGQTNGQVYFTRGWDNFIKESSVQVGEFLVFHYRGHGLFDFIIFETSGCEKKYVSASTKNEKKVSFLDTEDADKRKGKQALVEIEYRIGDNDDDDNDTEDEQEEEKEQEEEDNNIDDDEDGVDEDGVDEDGVDEDGVVEDGVVEDGVDEDDVDEDDVDEDGVDEDGIDEDDDSDDEITLSIKDDVIEIEKYVNPQNPFFITKVRARDRSYLYVPSDVIKDYKMNFFVGREMIFRRVFGGKSNGEGQSLGSEWKGVANLWKDGRVWISGWRKFCRWNKVNKDDRCICEFQSSKGNVIHVHVV